MYEKKYGALIKEIRKQNKLTQVQFANRLGVSQTHISKVENNTERASMPLRKLMCILYHIPGEALGVEVDEWTLDNREGSVRMS